MSKKAANHATLAVSHMTNLYAYGAIIDLLEGSSGPRGTRAYKASARILNICRREMAAELKSYDSQMANVEKN